MDKLLIALFFIAALVHIIACAFGKQKVRKISKAFLMPLLAAGYILSVSNPQIWVILGILFGWVGDLLLMRPKERLFQLLGTVSFVFGHICYIMGIYRRFAVAPPLWAYIAVPLVCAAISVFIYMRLLPIIDRSMHTGAAAYYLVLTALSSACTLVLFSGWTAGLYLIIGSVMFIVSDTTLCYQTFTVGDPAPKLDFTVMLTYIIAQACIVTGFCM